VTHIIIKELSRIDTFSTSIDVIMYDLSSTTALPRYFYQKNSLLGEVKIHLFTGPYPLN